MLKYLIKKKTKLHFPHPSRGNTLFLIHLFSRTDPKNYLYSRPLHPPLLSWFHYNQYFLSSNPMKLLLSVSSMISIQPFKAILLLHLTLLASFNKYNVSILKHFLYLDSGLPFSPSFHQDPLQVPTYLLDSKYINAKSLKPLSFLCLHSLHS